MYLPIDIKKYIKNKSYEIDDIGMSGSTILMFDDMVLKIQDFNIEVESEIEMMKWLEGKVNVPKVICHVVENEKSYLLMSRMKGKMSCDEGYLENNEVLVDVLAFALKSLWQVNLENCPVNWNLENKLKLAKYRVDHHLVNVDDCDPHTFSEDGFKDPQELYHWLVKNQPKEDLVLSHGDFCLPNIFIQDSKFAGLIDIGKMGISDKWQDIALCYRSLRDNMNGSYGGKNYVDFDPCVLFKKLGIEIDEEKLKYYLLVDELF